MMATTATVLITGATGFIGFRTLVTLLKSSYAVKIAIRKSEQQDKILSAASIRPYLENVQFVLVPDMTTPDAYMAAIIGVDFVIHVASPVPSKVENEGADKSFTELFYDPAIKGTTEMLKAATSNPFVRRVVITSSGNVLASVMHEPGAGDTDIRRCPSWEEIRAVKIPGQAYKDSKILAITAARDFMKSQHANGVHHFSVVHVCPGYVQGSHELCSSVDELLTTTSRATVDLALGHDIRINVMSQIWVEDVAKAHVASLTSAKVGDGDVLVLVGNNGAGWEWTEVGHLIRTTFAGEVRDGILKPSVEQKSIALDFDSRGTERKLGWQFAEPEVWVKEVVEQYLILRKKRA
jgi:nucleoside-diphosphate-sugar epimerase